MKTTSTRRTRLAKRLALGLAIAAVAAPAAQAGVTIPPELSGRAFGPGGSGQRTYTLPAIPPELSGRQFSPTTGGGVVSEPGAIPGQLEGRRFGPSSLPLVTMPEDLSGREFGPATFTPDLPVVTPVADGFDWRDAGIGAAAVVAAVALLAAAALLIGRRRTLAGA
jgi:hypothetical protein